MRTLGDLIKNTEKKAIAIGSSLIFLISMGCATVKPATGIIQPGEFTSTYKVSKHVDYPIIPDPRGHPNHKYHLLDKEDDEFIWAYMDKETTKSLNPLADELKLESSSEYILARVNDDKRKEVPIHKFRKKIPGIKNYQTLINKYGKKIKLPILEIQGASYFVFLDEPTNPEARLGLIPFDKHLRLKSGYGGTRVYAGEGIIKAVCHTTAQNETDKYTPIKIEKEKTPEIEDFTKE